IAQVAEHSRDAGPCQAVGIDRVDVVGSHDLSHAFEETAAPPGPEHDAEVVTQPHREQQAEGADRGAHRRQRANETLARSPWSMLPSGPAVSTTSRRTAAGSMARLTNARKRRRGASAPSPSTR